MNHPADIESLPEAARKVLTGPAPMKLMLARGMAPLPPMALVSALYALAHDSDAKLAEAARTTLTKLPDGVIAGALGHAELPGAVLDDLADRFRARGDLLESIVRHPNIADETLEKIAAHAPESLCELIATNEQRLLKTPAVIRALYFNKYLRMSTADRIVELAARHGLELDIPGFKDIVASLKDQLILEPGQESPADTFFRDALAVAEAVEGETHPDEDVVDRDEEGEEKLKEKFQEVDKRLEDMTVSEKIRAALIGTPGQRAILVRSPNRMVARAAISSPRMQESEVAKICASRSVGEDVLRIIADRRDWTRNHQVKVSLVFNPKTPTPSSMRLLPHLRELDLKNLQRSKNVPQVLKSSAAALLSKRGGKG